MGTFTASLRAMGDVKSLPAVVELSDGSLRILAGSTEIGSWPLDEIHLEEIPTGYRLAAEGDQIILEFRDVDAFAAELNTRTKKRLRRGRKKDDGAKRSTTVGSDSGPTKTAAEPAVKVDDHPDLTSKPIEPPKPVDKAKPVGTANRGLALLDNSLAKAKKRFGPYLPDWVFTRAMFAIAFGALVFMVALPGVVSTFLLIAGSLMIVFGAIVYSDAMLASRWLPGRTTPQHALLFGVAILMMGVLLGVIAN